MSHRDMYKHLLGRPYIPGKQDCYGLVRAYFKDVYGIQLTNYARPNFFWEDDDLDLIMQFLTVDGWELEGLNVRHLQVGDGLVFSIPVRKGEHKANHVGIYVGNGMFIHHLYQCFSSEEALTQKWTSRLLTTVRFKGLEEFGKGMQPKTDILSLATPYVRSKLLPKT